MEKLTIEGLTVSICRAPGEKICYVLYPFDAIGDWATKAAAQYGVNVVTVEGMDWDNDLSPWPATGVPAGNPYFRGLAGEFMKTIVDKVVPEVEIALGLTVEPAQRTILGVSMSALFATWAWVQIDTFNNLASISGSFWYVDFVHWLKQHYQFRGRGRKAFFCIGDREQNTSVPQYRTVRMDTNAVVNFFDGHGVDVIYSIVPGNHYDHPIRRLDRAMTAIYTPAQ